MGFARAHARADFPLSLYAQTRITMPMTNNDIMKKLRVALKLSNTDIVAICKHVDFKVSESELGAIFRSEDHPKYKECGDQFLRNFLNGLIIHMRGPAPEGAKHKEKE
jgi:uncharacterized protein YehS (DUF1456 family)